MASLLIKIPKANEVPTVPIIKLYDVNDDCLRGIFKCLNECDLVAVVYVCTRFHKLGREIYAQKVKGKKVTWTINESMLLLCRFGDLIPNLKVNLDPKSVSFNRIYKTLEDYCLNSLTELCIEQGPKMYFEEVFECVQLDQNFKLNFPNLKILECYGIILKNWIEQPFPQLNQVRFHKTVLATETLSKFLSLNPQIENVCLFNATPINAETGPHFNKYMIRLKVLQIKDGWNGHISLTSLISPELQFSNLQKLTMWCDSIDDQANHLINFTSYAPNIRQIELLCHIWIEMRTASIIALFHKNHFLNIFQLYALDIESSRAIFDQNFHEELLEVTSNREDFSIQLIVYFDHYKITINKETMRAQKSSNQEGRQLLRRMNGDCNDS